MKLQENSISVLISLLATSYGVYSYAHEEPLVEYDPVPACTSVAEDPDGDGHGWVSHFTGAHACVVTSDTKPRPLYVDVYGATRPYTMNRNYWDPNVDFANREIECTNYTWSEEQSKVEVKDKFTITHSALPDSELAMGEYEIRIQVSDSESHTGTGTWRSSQGRYISESYYLTPDKPLKMFADPWGEVVKMTASKEGMRFWYKHLQLQGDDVVIDGSEFQECQYTSDESFTPSGHWDKVPAEFQSVVQGIGPSAYPPGMPLIVHPQTGGVLELNELDWNLEEDLFHKKIWCSDFYWNEVDGFDSVYAKPDGYLFMPPSPGESSGDLYVDSRGNGTYIQYDWYIEDGVLKTTSLFPADGWYETVTSDNGLEEIRVWSPNAYDACSLDIGDNASQEPVIDPAVDPAEINESAQSESDTQSASPAQATDEKSKTEVPTEQSSVSRASTGGGSLSLFLLIIVVFGRAKQPGVRAC